MKSGSSKMMHGFLCQSHASTAVCIPGDPRSVIVPRRPDRTLGEHARLLDLKYSRLSESRRFSATSAEKRQPELSTLPALPPRVVTRRERTVTAPPKAVVTVPASSSQLPSTHGDVFQVVVMRVSIHCQGCAGKVRKHISKMEGVTSFSIDLESKRVTVMGHISPLGVLESISKVKKAEFWHNTSCK